MNRLFVFLFPFMTFCEKNTNNAENLSSNIQIYVAPYGRGSELISSRPIIFLSGGSKICRPRPFVSAEAFKYLTQESIKDTFLENLVIGGNVAVESENSGGSGENEGADTGGGQGGDSPGSSNLTLVASTAPIRTTVTDNWLKFGLWIANNNKGENNFFLIVRDITFIATARYRGEIFEHRGNVSSGYCNGPPYLYLVPPQTKVTYSPLTANPFHNLTIYFDGFEIVDYSEEPSPILRLGESNTSTSSGQGETTNTSGSDTRSYQGGPLLVIPNYTVQMTLIGSFLTRSGEERAPFRKRVFFQTTSSLD